MLSTGQQAEELAYQYLEQQSLVLCERNYRCKSGEIDLVMRDQNVLVFVEVRFRSHLNYGSGIESVTYCKQQRIIHTATHYLQKHKLLDNAFCRFDVVALGPKLTSPIEWVKDAFHHF